MRLSALIWIAVAALACGGEDPPAEPVADTTGEDTGATIAPDVNCTNACKRAARCADALVTEADCNKLCEDADKPQDYACCLQYSADCHDVTRCVQGFETGCDPSKSDPWMPLDAFDDCSCGNEGDFQYWKTHECKESGAGHPCPTGHVCYKPPNSISSAFCTVDCTLDASVCFEGSNCTDTPQSNYCKKTSTR